VQHLYHLACLCWLDCECNEKIVAKRLNGGLSWSYFKSEASVVCRHLGSLKPLFTTAGTKEKDSLLLCTNMRSSGGETFKSRWFSWIPKRE